MPGLLGRLWQSMALWLSAWRHAATQQAAARQLNTMQQCRASLPEATLLRKLGWFDLCYIKASDHRTGALHPQSIYRGCTSEHVGEACQNTWERGRCMSYVTAAV